MIVSTQAPFRDRFEIAHALGIEVDAIRIIAPYLGGGFGGKDGATVQCLLALAALHAGGRPVKMCWEREESFIAGYKRHPVRMRYRLGSMRDGTLHALHCRLYLRYGRLCASGRGGHGARYGTCRRAVPYPEYSYRGLVRLHE